MGVQPGDQVIIPGFTCVVVPNAIVYLGATPIYVDIDAKTYNIDPNKIEAEIVKRRSGKIKAIVAQHTFGIPADMDPIIEIAKKHGLFVIEDACHSIGSIYKGKEVGTLGNAAFFSSQWSKPVTTGLGGWAMVSDRELCQKLDRIHTGFIEPSLREILLLRSQYHCYSTLYRPSTFWRIQSVYRMLSRFGLAIGSSSVDELEYKMPAGYFKKMSVWQRKLLQNRFEIVHVDIAHRRGISAVYEAELRQNGIAAIKSPEQCQPVFLKYPVLVRDKDETLKEARRERIEVGDWFRSPVHPNINGWEKVFYHKNTCPVAEETCRHIVNLPTHRGIGEAEAMKTARFIVDRAHF